MSGESRQRLRWPLHIDEERCGEVLVVTLAGRVGAGSAAALRERLNATIARGDRDVVVDFGSVDYVSSPGLMTLEAANARLRTLGGTLVLCNVPEPVRMVLDLAGLLVHFRLEPSRERALARASSPDDPGH